MCHMWHPTAESWQASNQPKGLVLAVACVPLEERKADPACGCLRSAQVSFMARVALTNFICQHE